ncbi:hypothetical protein BDP27DRAFT_1315299 [Rhodocollybia butyracea]|uniref:Uncharacterized protein n=1 Tax=Rhodocollybia butyracea TaxID=206335 RepID=A0A9P5Q6T9_9AGAR|nr:hypothetical protein BDP27DRAFT_1315299 [Rhodocollybia butyracea]
MLRCSVCMWLLVCIGLGSLTVLVFCRIDNRCRTAPYRTIYFASCLPSGPVKYLLQSAFTPEDILHHYHLFPLPIALTSPSTFLFSSTFTMALSKPRSSIYAPRFAEVNV